MFNVRVCCPVKYGLVLLVNIRYRSALKILNTVTPLGILCVFRARLSEPLIVIPVPSVSRSQGHQTLANINLTGDQHCTSAIMW